MKKIILGIALMSFVIGCQKVQPGSNKGVIKITDDVERYSDEEMSDEASAHLDAIQAVEYPSDSTKTTAKPVEIVKKDSAMEVKTPVSPAAKEVK
jgi:hypothetical protein